MSFLIFVVAIWAGSLVVWTIVSRAFKSADVDRMKSRILETAAKKAKKDKSAQPTPELIRTEDKSTGRLVMRILARADLNRRLEELIEQAGLKWRPARVVHTCLGLFLGGFFAARLTGLVPYMGFQILAGLALSSLPIIHLFKTRSKRMHKFEEQFPESLEFVARSMRAGHAFSVSLEMIHREFQEPLAGEFRRAFDEHNLGLPLDQALLKLATRVPILDVHFFVSAVLLQKRTGGNLAEILDKLAYVIRERFKLRGKIRAISAHGRMTGMALTMIPLAVALLMFYVNPSYVAFFVEDEVGNIMVGVAVALQVIGYLIIRKIVSIEV
jgi:tight adherence protein B